MDEMAKPRDLARSVTAAAAAGWWTLLVGLLFVAFQGIIYLVATHTILMDWVSCVWNVDRSVACIAWFVFIGVLKLALILWALRCVFLTLWARRLR